VTLSDRDTIGANPFSTRYIRPGAIEFRFPPGDDAKALVQRLRARDWRGEIIGPHGSGKSSLLAALVPALRDAGKSVLLVELHDGQRRLPVDLKRHPDATGDGVVIVDGYEQLSWLSRLGVKRVCRRRGMGLLVTSHKPAGLPELYRTAPTLELARSIVESLVAGRSASITSAELAERYALHQGNLREMLFDLYDLYESRRLTEAADRET
jgi:hypothetical protein